MLQDKRTKYKETGPDQHTASTTTEYLSFVRMSIEKKAKTKPQFGALEQSPSNSKFEELHCPPSCRI